MKFLSILFIVIAIMTSCTPPSPKDVFKGVWQNEHHEFMPIDEDVQFSYDEIKFSHPQTEEYAIYTWDYDESNRKITLNLKAFSSGNPIKIDSIIICDTFNIGNKFVAFQAKGLLLNGLYFKKIKDEKFKAEVENKILRRKILKKYYKKY